MGTELQRAERCETCRFWSGDRIDPAGEKARAELAALGSSSQEDTDYSLERFKSWKEGNCRRYPPVVLTDPEDWMMARDRFPHTDADDYCGEWRARDRAGVVRTRPDVEGDQFIALLKLWQSQGLSWEVARCAAARWGVSTPAELAALGATNLMRVKGCGPATLARIDDYLAGYGLTLAE